MEAVVKPGASPQDNRVPSDAEQVSSQPRRTPEGLRHQTLGERPPARILFDSFDCRTQATVSRPPPTAQAYLNLSLPHPGLNAFPSNLMSKLLAWT
jgi:hypothetical protein